ncbi:MAG: hypothetical protein GY903_11180 [Fuerstiella sp.]|nr:hypothetical protein [Fuerstiella sp.]MCP4855044.1 hypothetical protein [Fuerstiella sp.]
MSPAAHLYFRTNQRFPRTAGEFLSDYLPGWPGDPFSDNEERMRYRFNAETGNATVWSVGPNGTDDGGHVDAHANATDFDFGQTIRAPR